MLPFRRPPLRALVVSDTHSNLEGLRAVIAHAKKRGGFDELWCCGDIVGYGAEPSALMAELRRHEVQSVAGNHDCVAAGLMDVREFNLVAGKAALWTRDTISKQEQAWLGSLPMTLTIDEFTLVHGSLREPVWEYLQSAAAAAAQFELQETPYSIVGHSHIQFWCEERSGATPRFHGVRDGDSIALDATRLILNPGSTGQPRDGDPRAGYMLYDDAAHTVTWHRVKYDAEATGKKIIAAGLPRTLASRLLTGN